MLGQLLQQHDHCVELGLPKSIRMAAARWDASRAAVIFTVRDERSEANQSS